MVHSGQEILEASIVTLVFALGLQTDPAERDGAAGHRLLVRAVVARDVFIPLLVMTVLSMAGTSPQAVVGATLLAISPGLPVVLQRELKHGRRAVIVRHASTVGVLLSIVSVPFWLSVASRLFVDDASMMVFPVARLIALLFLIPFGAGVVMRRLAPRAMARASEPIVLVADLLLLIAALFLLPDAVRALPRLGAAYPIAIAGITAFSLLVGDVAAGSQAPDRRAVSLICAARHPGLALLVAQSNFPDGGVLPAVMVSLVVATLVTMPYALWRQRGLVPATVEVLPSAADVSVTVDTPLLAPPPSR